MNNHSLLELLLRNREYNIVGHIRPDGDCIGSQLAIYHILQQYDIQCNIIKNDDYGSVLSGFLDGCDVIQDDQANYELPLICVDCSDFARTGKFIPRNYERPYLNIDHHISNNNYGEYNFIDPDAVSTTEVIARLLANDKVDYGKLAAEMIYLGIMTDSNRFAYSTTTKDTLKITESLVERGADLPKIYNAIYEHNSIERYRLLTIFLKNITVFNGGLCCTSFVTADDFKNTGAQRADTEGFVDYTRALDGVQAGAFLEIHDEYIKCSMRSRSTDIRMDILASQFGGGGHPAASGFIVQSPTPDFYKIFQSALAEHVTRFYENK